MSTELFRTTVTGSYPHVLLFQKELDGVSFDEMDWKVARATPHVGQR
jgi:hypothetical protein